MMRRVEQTARIVFNITTLHPMQKIVIQDLCNSLMAFKKIISSGCQPDDISSKQVVLLPTGAGKSLCFMLPALLFPTPTLIIYPLLALMNDQERRLEQLHIPYVTFRGGMTAEQKQQAFEKINQGVKCIIANPEVLQNPQLLAKLATYNLSHIAIDESHCVCEWGDTFRPAYLTLGTIIKKLNPITATAFTATASQPVLRRIIEVLFYGSAHIIQGEGNRPNLHFFVRYAPAKRKAVLRIAATEQRPIVIFCRTRKITEQMAHMLTAYFGHTVVRFYHAGLEKDEKKEIEQFLFDEKQAIITCTCALGMGVDVPGIRTVVHVSPPPSVESYVQESGRGGRDGNISKAILLWNHHDLETIQKDTSGRMQFFTDYIQSTTCKRKLLLSALGTPDAQTVQCTGCERCNTEPSTTKNEDDESYAYDLIKRNTKLWTLLEASHQIQIALNQRDHRFYHGNVWEHKDVMEILLELKQKGKIALCRYLWKGRVRICKTHNR